MKILRAGEKEFDRYVSEVEGRAAQDGLRFEVEVRSILEDVRKRGEAAVIHYTRVFDGLRIPTDQREVKRREVRQAYGKVSRDFLGTLKEATRRIRKFHRHLLGKARTKSLKEEGIWLGQTMRPLEKVGIYVPGGKASYPSTVLMAAIPAKVAGVREILMVTPPRKEGISPAVLVAADLAGVDRIYRIGGVQAIAA
ncbi:MAG: histidinol dehydrogenase, partial [Thermodesulfobacteriota bacterium]